MIPKFIQITTGQYSFAKSDQNFNKVQEIGHCVYGLDKEGQIWKWVCQNGKWQWAELESTTPDYYA